MVRPVNILEPLHVVLIKNLRAASKEFAEEVRAAPDDEGEAVFRKGYGTLNLLRFAYVRNLEERGNYKSNEDELISFMEKTILEAVPMSLEKDGSYTSMGPNIVDEDFFLSIQIMASFDTIGTEKAFKALYNCLTNGQIDLTARYSVIPILALVGRSESLEVLKNAEQIITQETREIMPPELAEERVNALKNAIEVMEKKEF